MKSSLRPGLAITLLVAWSSSATPAPLPIDASWLMGSWCAATPHETLVETWMPRGDVLFGVSVTTRAGKVIGFEFLRIASLASTPEYIAQPDGRPPTTFKLTDSGPLYLRFENPDHDFPQRIEYRLQGTKLEAKVSGTPPGGMPTDLDFRFERCAKQLSW
jgi:hypothetical protein